MPALSGLLETALYVTDMQMSVRFFEEVLELKAMLKGDRLTAFDAGSSGVLLICKHGASLHDMKGEDGIVPGHDGAGPMHMAFAIPSASYEEWLAYLHQLGIKMRGEMRWPAGGRSIYFEDPDGHVLELATPGLWPNY